MAGSIQIDGISKSFGRHLVLDRIDLSIAAGEVHALAGANGAGKSTLIKILTGYHAPDVGGRVLVDSEPLPFGDPSASRSLGITWVHQGRSVVGEMSAAENLGLVAGFSRRGGRVDRRAQCRLVEAELARLGVEFDVEAPLSSLGPVEGTTTAIATALAGADQGARLLILDEPTAALPGPEVGRLFQIVRNLCKQGTAVLYVSHRIGEIFDVADRVSVLRDGRLELSESIGKLSERDLVGAITGGDRAASAARGSGGEDGVERLPGRTDGAGSALRVHALRSSRLAGVSLDLGRGEVLGICGLAGSGREELLAAIAQAIPSQVDSLTIEGDEIASPDAKSIRQAGVAYVPGNRRPGSAAAALNVRENITLPLLSRYRRYGMMQIGAERRATLDWIDRTQLRPRDPERPFALLSGGNQQKAILAKWFNVSPRVVLLDEPTAGVDVAARKVIYQLIRRRAEEGISFLIASTEDEEIVRVCRRVLVLAHGTVAAELEEDDVTEFNVVRASSAAYELAELGQREEFMEETNG